ncbi:class I SAM-dependent methyltransferase [Subtercola sp. YIM 133946]|uniref:class I SAM-dependent methyltransferase n=1 Tax=Subtercola sp. YIM 133946 TaxID=3118909 RepID=UPI002F92B5C8
MNEFDFDFETLRRWPDIEAPNLFASDASDRLILDEAAEALTDIDGRHVVVIGDRYGALTLGAAARFGLSGIRVHQDALSGEQALAANAERVGFGTPRASGTNAPDAVTGTATGTAGGTDAIATATGAPGSTTGTPGTTSGTPGTATGTTSTSGTPGAAVYENLPLDEPLLAAARVVLLQLPRSLAELDEIADAIARFAAPDVVVYAGGRLKHLSIAMNDVLRARFAEVHASRARQKSRALIASGVRRPTDARPYPRLDRNAELGLTIAAHGGAFAGTTLDIGTRFLLTFLDRLDLPTDPPTTPTTRAAAAAAAATPTAPTPVTIPTTPTAPTPVTTPTTPSAPDPVTTPTAATPVAIDLGCGTGIIAAVLATQHPALHVIATDQSYAATSSARATMAANDLGERVTIVRDNGLALQPDASADLIVCNPPFHVGSSVHTGAALAMFRDAGRVLRPGGRLLTVFNSHLGYQADLRRSVGDTRMLGQNPKFTVTLSTRRP